MTYIFLVAGKGSRLHPLTYSYPKSLYKLDMNTTVIQRMIDLIAKHDTDARIVVVTGFMGQKIKDELDDVVFVNNPFFGVTNSIASLWFAMDYLKGDVVIINGDIIVSDRLMREVIVSRVDRPLILLDSSIRSDGDYNVQTSGDHVVVMSKEIRDYNGEYAGITKLNGESAQELLEEISLMISEGHSDQWYENALVQLIFRRNFRLGYIDISEYDWAEIDCANDLMKAQDIHRSDTRGSG